MLTSKFLLKQSRILTLQKASLRSFASSSGDVMNLIDSVRADGDNTQGIENIDEYFRLNFRKMSFDQAVTLLKKVHDVESLEDSFWVWETLEEAIRPQILDTQYEIVTEIQNYFGHFQKGSTYLWDDFFDAECSNVSIF